MERSKEHIQEVIAWLRLPLMALVVLNHTRLLKVVVGGEQMAEYSRFFTRFVFLFSENFCRVAVPLFFLFSGWLFFRGVDHFSRQEYIEKLRKRLYTLLLPYLIWNLLTILAQGAGNALFPGLAAYEKGSLLELSPGEWLQLFWHRPESLNSPACGPLWFVRDLMVVMLFSLPIYHLIKRWKGWIPLLFLAAWMVVPYRYSMISGMSISSFLFFSMGAWWSLSGYDFTATARRIWPIAALLYGLFLFLIFYFGSIRGWLYPLYNLGILCGMTLTIAGVSTGLRYFGWRVNSTWASGSFFVYVAHILPITLLTKLATVILHPTQNWELVGLYFLCPTLVIVALLAIYTLMRRYTPGLLSFLTGGRI